MHTIKPIDKEAIIKAVQETRRIVTFEDHNIIGGLGGAVAEVIAENGRSCAFQRVGIPDTYTIIGYPEDIMNYYKIDTDGIVEKVRESWVATLRQMKTGKTRFNDTVESNATPRMFFSRKAGLPLVALVALLC